MIYATRGRLVMALSMFCCGVRVNTKNLNDVLSMLTVLWLSYVISVCDVRVT